MWQAPAAAQASLSHEDRDTFAPIASPRARQFSVGTPQPPACLSPVSDPPLDFASPSVTTCLIDSDHTRTHRERLFPSDFPSFDRCHPFRRRGMLRSKYAPVAESGLLRRMAGAALSNLSWTMCKTGFLTGLLKGWLRNTHSAQEAQRTAPPIRRATALGVSVAPATLRASRLIGLRAQTLPADPPARLAELRVYVSVRGDSICVSPHAKYRGGGVCRVTTAIRTRHGRSTTLRATT
jgi:hypothetical protein